jgi:hypothetical protein
MKTDLISTHYANDDARHFAFVRRTGYRRSEFRQEWRPRLRDVVAAIAIVVALFGGLWATAGTASDEEIGARLHQVQR